jgi:signal transduction histidine kinase
LKRHRTKLRQKNYELENANKAKSDFLANMSHELRTPLNHIIGFAEIISDNHCGELNEQQADMLKDILNSGKHLLSLINDILDLSKVEAGKVALELVDVNLEGLLKKSLTMVKERALKHGIRLSASINDIPVYVRADERKIKQILYNLLSNAVKFTLDGGEVLLSTKIIKGIVRLGRRWDDSEEIMIFERPAEEADLSTGSVSECIELTVSDTGIGIAKENQSQIFNNFEQIESSSSRSHEGTGIGLSLTKKLVELHGGKIWVESEGKNKGSTFRFVLPIL